MKQLRLISLGANVVFIAIIVWLLLKKHTCSCDDCFQDNPTVTIKIDTIRPKDKTPVLISKEVPPVIKEWKKPSQPRPPVVTTHGDTVICPDYCYEPGPCDSVRVYSKELSEPDNYDLIITDTLTNNSISGRSVYFKNLMPQITKTTTITKYEKEKFKVFVGAVGTFNARNLDRWDAGPGVLISIPKVMAISYNYGIHNNAHTVGAYALLRFNKK